MNLADKVIEANKIEKKRKSNTDELGLGIADTTDYIVARALYINTLERRKDAGVGLLHNRHHRELWKGNVKLPKNKQTIYELARPRRTIRDYELDAIWDSLLKNTPTLDETKIVIDPHTYWDINEGSLVHSDDKLITI